MPRLIAEKVVRARNAHACQTCFQTAVQPGEQYTRSTYAADGHVYNWVMCDACRNISAHVFKWIDYDGGIGADEYDEWAYDTGWGADQDPQSQTDEQKAAIAYLVRRRKMIVDHAWIGVAGHSDDPECTHRAGGTDETLCGELEYRHLHSSR